MKKQITIGVGEAAPTAKEFIDVWKLAERGETVQEKHRLHFRNLELLLKTLTPGRWTLLKKLQANKNKGVKKQRGQVFILDISRPISFKDPNHLQQMG